jgi:Na+-transporting methylmalonyl-CoA/oxaloacetate decarboxylase gamma subunit
VTGFYEEVDTSDWETFQDGLFISMVGIGIVFAVLVLLALGSMLMEKIDSMYPVDAASIAGQTVVSRPRPLAPAPTPPAPAAVPVSDAQTAAAIGVALALAERESAPRGLAPRPVSLHNGNGNGGGSWVQSGRLRQLGSWTHGAGRGRQR